MYVIGFLRSYQFLVHLCFDVSCERHERLQRKTHEHCSKPHKHFLQDMKTKADCTSLWVVLLLRMYSQYSYVTYS